MDLMAQIAQRQLKKSLPPFRAGDTVRVHVRVREGEKERIQIFEGVVMSKRGHAISETFTVRKVSYGIGVERIFPMHSPYIEKIEVKTRGKVRRAKLYYLRDLSGRAARIAEYEGVESVAAPEAPEVAAPVVE